MSAPRQFVKVHSSFPESAEAAALSDSAFRSLVELWCGAKNRPSRRAMRQLEAHGFVRDGQLAPSAMFEDGPLVTTRPPIDEALRESIYARDGYACVACSSRSDLTLDHIYPWSLGGKTVEANLQTLCRPCNSRKGARL